MSKAVASLCISLLLTCCITGCWDKAELMEYGYVQAVAIDQNEQGNILLTTLFYNPSGHGESTGMTPQPKMAIPIHTEAGSVYEAVQDIPLHFGRRAKWDHMRIILIGEGAARSRPIGELLDFFSRNHEQRATVLLLVTKGDAKTYIEIHPYIEYTIGQQLRKIEESVSRYSAKTTKMPLYELAIQLAGETSVAMIPHAYLSNKGQDIVVAGIALLHNQRLTRNTVSPDLTPSLMMLLNRYDQGVVEIPCTASPKSTTLTKESFEVISAATRIKLEVHGEDVTAKVRTKLKGSMNELHCSSIQTVEEQQRMRTRISDQVSKDMQQMIAFLQERKLDAIGIGNKLYRKHPALWKQWRKDWDERFAKMTFDIQAEVDITNLGLNAGKSFGQQKETNE